MADTDKTLKLRIDLDGYVMPGAKEVQDKLSAAKSDLAKENDVIVASQADVEAATKKATNALNEDASATGKLGIKKHELKEIIHSLTGSFPLLGQAARAALNPIVFLVAAPIVAFEIFKSRVEAATEALSEVKMPDLTSGIEQAHQLQKAWNGVAEAVAKANHEFNSPGNVYTRSTSEIDKNLDSEKKLLALQKEKALANLESQKGSMSAADYTIGKTGIENYYTQQGFEADKNASDKKLAARYYEKLAADKRSESAGKAAAAIKLPQSDDEFKAQQDALTSRMAARNSDETKAQAELDKIKAAKADVESGNLWKKTKAGLGLYYNYGSDAEHIDKIVGGQVKRAQEDQAAIAKEIARRQKLFDQRSQLRDEAPANAGLETEIGLGLPGERRDWQRNNRTSAIVNDGTQQINAQKAVNEIRNSGANFGQVIGDLNTALEWRDRNIYRQLEILTKQIQHGRNSLGGG